MRTERETLEWLIQNFQENARTRRDESRACLNQAEVWDTAASTVRARLRELAKEDPK